MQSNMWISKSVIAVILGGGAGPVYILSHAAEANLRYRLRVSTVW